MNFEYDFENTEVLVACKVVVQELLRRITYMVEIAQSSVEDDNWGLMAGALAVLEETNTGIAEVVIAAQQLVPAIEHTIGATTFDVWVKEAKRQAKINGYEMSVEARMVQQQANEQLGL